MCSSTDRAEHLPVLRLPGEIRNEIYSFAVSGFVILVKTFHN